MISINLFISTVKRLNLPIIKTTQLLSFHLNQYTIFNDTYSQVKIPCISKYIMLFKQV